MDAKTPSIELLYASFSPVFILASSLYAVIELVFDPEMGDILIRDVLTGATGANATIKETNEAVVIALPTLTVFCAFVD
jgi:hypothetical protein